MFCSKGHFFFFFLFFARTGEGGLGGLIEGRISSEKTGANREKKRKEKRKKQRHWVVCLFLLFFGEEVKSIYEATSSSLYGGLHLQ